MIKEYLGAEIVVYFEAVELYILALCPAAAAGCVLWAVERWGSNRRQALWTELYRLLMNLWAVGVAWGWDHYEKKQAEKDVEQRWSDVWSTLRTQIAKRKEAARGRAASSKTTRRRRRQRRPRSRSERQRLWEKLRSWGLTAAMLGGTFVFVVAALNLEGLMEPTDYSRATMARWRDSWAVRLLRFAPLSDLTRPGAVFDPDPERGSRSLLRFALANLRMLCPLVFHAVGFAALTQSTRASTLTASSRVLLSLANRSLSRPSVYEMSCEWLTDHTKELSRLQRRNAMIVRRVAFECIDGWMPLALIAWSRSGGSRRDELRAEMLTLYICDILRRLFCESVFPLVLKLRRDRAMYQAPTPPNQLGSRSVAARTQTAAEKQLQALEWQAAVEHEASRMTVGIWTAFSKCSRDDLADRRTSATPSTTTSR